VKKSLGPSRRALGPSGRPGRPGRLQPPLVAAGVALGLAVVATLAAAERVSIGPFVALGTESSRRGNYAEPGGGPARRGRVRGLAPTSAPKPQWTLQLRQRNLAAPVLAADGTLYVAGDRGVSAIDSAGKLLWFARAGKVGQSPTLEPGGGLLVVAGTRLLRVTGRDRWSELESGLVAAGPPLRLSGGAIAIASPAGRVHVLDPAGVHLARTPLPPSRRYRMAQLEGGSFVVSGPPRRMSVVSVRGGLRGRFEQPHDVVAGPVIGASSTVWTVGDNGVLLGQSPRGRQRARVPLGPGRIQAPPAVGRDGLLRVGAEPPVLLGLGPGGRRRFGLTLDGRPGPITLDERDAALLVTDRGYLYVVEPDGSLRFRHGVHARGAPRPVLGADGRVFIADRAGRVTAWR